MVVHERTFHWEWVTVTQKCSIRGDWERLLAHESAARVCPLRQTRSQNCNSRNEGKKKKVCKQQAWHVWFVYRGFIRGRFPFSPPVVGHWVKGKAFYYSILFLGTFLWPPCASAIAPLAFSLTLFFFVTIAGFWRFYNCSIFIYFVFVLFCLVFI